MVALRYAWLLVLVINIDQCILVDDKFVAPAEWMAHYDPLPVDADDPPTLDSLFFAKQVGDFPVLVPDHYQLTLRRDRDAGDLEVRRERFRFRRRRGRRRFDLYDLDWLGFWVRWWRVDRKIALLEDVAVSIEGITLDILLDGRVNGSARNSRRSS